MDNVNPRVDEEDFERSRWKDEVRLREIELEARAKEADAKLKEQEISAKRLELEQKQWILRQWANPLVVAVFAAAIAAAGNAFVALLNGQAQRAAEEIRSDQNLILEVLKADSDPDRAATNLSFVVETGLISNDERRSEIKGFLAGRSPGEGPSLPSVAGSRSPSAAPTCDESLTEPVLREINDLPEAKLAVSSCAVQSVNSFRYNYIIENLHPTRTAFISWHKLSGFVRPGGTQWSTLVSTSPPELIERTLSTRNSTHQIFTVAPKE